MRGARCGLRIVLVALSAASIAEIAEAKNECACKKHSAKASGSGDCSLAENRRICNIEYNEFNRELTGPISESFQEYVGSSGFKAFRFEYIGESLLPEQWAALSPDAFMTKLLVGLSVGAFGANAASKPLAETFDRGIDGLGSEQAIVEAVSSALTSDFDATILRDAFLSRDGEVETIGPFTVTGGCIEAEPLPQLDDVRLFYKTWWSPAGFVCGGGQ